MLTAQTSLVCAVYIMELNPCIIEKKLQSEKRIISREVNTLMTI